ncbi:hypothetical protein QOZ83_08025 [Romboutsia sedimentorum]|uniref:hypothetical protein n=1 Tax=Romboutsia sedimentorum TaxID=1368474 RepID=UPI0024DE68CB|nr:hypothetical protein [Romboutsia sedimentorum]MDK2585804.1 hypothetical protein [Romboutsia sedimentorum]
MKRAIKTLSVLCGGLLFISPITSTIFAQGTNDKPESALIEKIDKTTNKQTMQNNELKVDRANKEEIVKPNIPKVEVKNEVNTQVKNETTKLETKNEVVKQKIKDEVTKPQIKEETIKNEVIKKEETPVVENNKKEETVEQNTVKVIDVLSQQQAKELLQMYKKDANYAYQGDENTFNVLAQRGLSGYVFLPDYDTDLGFFVDKNTANIYYFHPSGYLELAL